MQEHKENNGMYVCVKEQAGVVRKEGWLVGWLVGWLEKKRARCETRNRTGPQELNLIGANLKKEMQT